MLKFLRKLAVNKRGNALLIAAGAMPMIVGCAGLASDTIQWSLWKRQLQRAADSAAMAGVYDRVNSSGSTSTVASTVAHDLTLNQHTWMSNLTGYPIISYPADTGVITNQVRVSLAVQKSLPFSSMFMTAAPTIIANSTAAGIPGGEYCVVSLEPLASKTGITIGGSANIDMDCGMISNSPATNSALSNGTSSRVKATVIAAVGGVQASNSWTVDQYNPYSPPIVDPYANVPVPTPTGCTAFPNTRNLNFTNDPNHAIGKTVCYNSDMQIQGNVVLGPATYILDAASLKMTSTGASLSCNGCTIILTSSTAATNPSSIGTISVSGGQLNLSPSTTVPYKGIALYQDRRALDSAGNNIINGNSGSIIQGVLYFPSQQLTYNGDGTTSALCTQFVTRRIIFSGNNTTSNKYARGSNCPILPGAIGGGSLVRLVA
jgi:Flp pilus assembly protein TadG